MTLWLILAFIFGLVCGFLAALGLRAMFAAAERDMEAEKDGGP